MVEMGSITFLLSQCKMLLQYPPCVCDECPLDLSSYCIFECIISTFLELCCLLHLYSQNFYITQVDIYHLNFSDNNHFHQYLETNSQLLYNNLSQTATQTYPNPIRPCLQFCQRLSVYAFTYEL